MSHTTATLVFNVLNMRTCSPRRGGVGKIATISASLTLTLALVSLAVAPSASAAPTGIFSIFSDCPLNVAQLCQYAQTTSGEFTIGAQRVPISKTITLQGGTIPTEETLAFLLVPATDGNSMSKTELSVPGGLRGMIGCGEINGGGVREAFERSSCAATLSNTASNQVMATTELAANAANPPALNLLHLATANGTAITLPLKIHLKNPFLGASCYIGSDARPIVLHLTTGATSPSPPNRSISGSIGTVELLGEIGQELLRLSKNSLVDNTYSAPAAQGCGGTLSPLITPIINAKLKLPSPSGTNTAILNGTLNTSSVEIVEGSEAAPPG